MENSRSIRKNVIHIFWESIRKNMRKCDRWTPMLIIGRIEINLAEMVTRWASTKIAKTNLICQKT